MSVTPEIMTLQAYLGRHPWEERWLNHHRPVEYFFAFDLPASAEALWPFLSDTSGLNRKLGLESIRFQEKNGRLYGSSIIAKTLHEWEEFPWQWEYAREVRAERIYSAGLLLFVRSHFILENTGPSSCTVYIYFGWIPRSRTGRMLFSLGRKRYHSKYRSVLAEFAAQAHRPIEFNIAPISYLATPAKTTTVDTTRIQDIQQRLLNENIPRAALDLLFRFIESAGDSDLYRMRPRKIAREWGIHIDHLLTAMLHSTRQGLLNLTWDLVCPHCRGVRGKINHLWEVPKRESCAVCGIDFDTTGINAIEISFHINPEIKKVDEVLYCSAEPAKKPHIRFQKNLLPDETAAVELAYPPGRYRLRIKGRSSYNLLDLAEAEERRDILWDDASENARFVTAPGTLLRLHNADAVHNTFIMESNEADADSLRPADLFNFQDFRDLFSHESLPADLSIDIGVQNIIFVDVVKSSAMYERVGNASAFAIVKSFFRKSHEIALLYRGAIIKTMGDAVLFSFEHPLDVLRAAAALSSVFDGGDPETPIQVRITANRGPCLAVNLNSAIDYFGSPVNVVAKLQSYADGGETVVTESFINDIGVREYLAAKGFDFSKSHTAGIKGVGEVPYWKLKLRTGHRRQKHPVKGSLRT